MIYFKYTKITTYPFLLSALPFLIFCVDRCWLVTIILDGLNCRAWHPQIYHVTNIGSHFVALQRQSSPWLITRLKIIYYITHVHCHILDAHVLNIWSLSLNKPFLHLRLPNACVWSCVTRGRWFWGEGKQGNIVSWVPWLPWKKGLVYETMPRLHVAWDSSHRWAGIFFCVQVNLIKWR